MFGSSGPASEAPSASAERSASDLLARFESMLTPAHLSSNIINGDKASTALPRDEEDALAESYQRALRMAGLHAAPAAAPAGEMPLVRPVVPPHPPQPPLLPAMGVRPAAIVRTGSTASPWSYNTQPRAVQPSAAAAPAAAAEAQAEEPASGQSVVQRIRSMLAARTNERRRMAPTEPWPLARRTRPFPAPSTALASPRWASAGGAGAHGGHVILPVALASGGAAGGNEQAPQRAVGYIDIDPWHGRAFGRVDSCARGTTTVVMEQLQSERAAPALQRQPAASASASAPPQPVRSATTRATQQQEQEQEQSGTTVCHADVGHAAGPLAPGPPALSCVSVYAAQPHVVAAIGGDAQGSGPIGLMSPPRRPGVLTSLNGASYTTDDLVAYLRSAPSAPKVIEHTGQVLSAAQIEHVLRLIAAGEPHLVASATSDAVYALREPLPPTNAVLVDQADTAAAAAAALLAEEGEALRHQRLVGAFMQYAYEIAALTGPALKPAINFGIARHMNIVDTELGSRPVMGRDLDAIAALLRAEADGLARTPANELAAMQLLAVRFPGMSETKRVRYALPWAHGGCCVLSVDDMNDMATGRASLAALSDAAKRQLAAQLVAPLALPQTAAAAAVDQYDDGQWRRPFEAWLADAEFAERLNAVDDATLLAIARAIPILGQPHGDAHAHADQPQRRRRAELVRLSNLSVGAPLAPPLPRSVEDKLARVYAGTPDPLLDMQPMLMAPDSGVAFVDDVHPSAAFARAPAS